MLRSDKLHIGTAGWSLPKQHAPLFPVEGSHLERYAQRFNAVEVNTCFYRDHLEKTYTRWAAAVPEDFRFALKLSKKFTHEQRLDVRVEDLKAVLQGLLGLGAKLAVLLVQLPPSLEFDLSRAGRFFHGLRTNFSAPVALEPRHLSWATAEAAALLNEFSITRVNADPEPVPSQTKDLSSLRYFRWHGSPEIYRSAYATESLDQLATQARRELKDGRSIWCIFDNTTFGHATENALQLQTLINMTEPSLNLNLPNRP